MNKIHIFLASSFELKNERREIEEWIGRKNNHLVDDKVFLRLHKWESVISAMSETRKQDDYNKFVEDSDIFISLFATKVGKYTEEEFNHAYANFLKKGKPKYIYTYFKDVSIKLSQLNIDELINLKRFENDLKELGHFPDYFDNSDHLIRQLDSQFDKILSDIIDSKKSGGNSSSSGSSNTEEIMKLLSKLKELLIKNESESTTKKEITKDYSSLKNLVKTSSDINNESKKTILKDNNYLFKLQQAKSDSEIRELMGVFEEKLNSIEETLKKTSRGHEDTSNTRPKKNIENIKQLIFNYKLKEAIQETLKLVKGTNTEKDVIILSSQFNKYEKERLVGLDTSDADLHQIIHGLLTILDEL